MGKCKELLQSTNSGFISLPVVPILSVLKWLHINFEMSSPTWTPAFKTPMKCFWKWILSLVSRKSSLNNIYSTVTLYSVLLQQWLRYQIYQYYVPTSTTFFHPSFYSSFALSNVFRDQKKCKQKEKKCTIYKKEKSNKLKPYIHKKGKMWGLNG